MPLYETVLIARNDVTQAQVEAIADDINTQIEAEGGKIEKREYWGLRTLTYRIKKNRKGHYMLLGLNTQPAQLREIERQLGLNEDVLRVLTLRVDEISQDPSPVLQRRSDDRGERSGGGFRGGAKPAGRFDSGRSGRRNYDDREEYRAREGRDDAPRDGAQSAQPE